MIPLCVSFCAIFMHFLNITHVWTLVLPCKSTTAQLNEKDGSAQFREDLMLFSLDNDHGALTATVVSFNKVVDAILPRKGIG